MSIPANGTHEGRADQWAPMRGAPTYGGARQWTPMRNASTRKGHSHRGMFSGNPLRAISCFSHQDAQTPPSPLVGEGGWGDEGQHCTGMRKTAHPAWAIVVSIETEQREARHAAPLSVQQSVGQPCPSRFIYRTDTSRLRTPPPASTACARRSSSAPAHR
jgi:hypothetical protein